MNTKSKARAPDRRLMPHLGRQDTNENVSIGRSRGVTPQLRAAMEELAIRSATVAAKKSWFHIVGNPDPKSPLDEAGWEGYWADVETEFDLGGQPFIEVVHRKHGREHKHRVYSLVRDDGRLVPVSHNYRRNELVSRLCEIANGHTLCPGPHHAWVLGRLAARGIALPAAQTRTHSGSGFGQDEHQQAERKLPGGDPRPFRRSVYGMYVAANGDPRVFAARLDRAGITVARGHKALLVVDESSTFALPLARLLREEGKRAGQPITIKTAELAQVFGRAKPLRDELAAVRERWGNDARDAGRAGQGGTNAQSRAEPERSAEAQRTAAADAFALRMTLAMQALLAKERRRRDRLERNRARNAHRSRPGLDGSIAGLLDHACLRVAAHVVWICRHDRVPRRTAMIWIAAIATVNGLAPVLLVAAAIGFVRRNDIAAERRRFRADVNEAKAARAGFRFSDVPVKQRRSYAALSQALDEGRSDPLPIAGLHSPHVTAFVAWWAHASNKQQSVVKAWGRSAASRRTPRPPRPSSSKGIGD